jgi:serine/threonine protein kinase
MPQSSESGGRFEYELYSCLAIGGFSKVYLSRNYIDGKFYAIKFIKKRPENQNHDSVLN